MWLVEWATRQCVEKERQDLMLGLGWLVVYIHLVVLPFLIFLII
jgi:hypothetical protein